MVPLGHFLDDDDAPVGDNLSPMQRLH